MVTVDLDPEGRLRSFTAMPPQAVLAAMPATVSPDWNAALADAGLDAKAFAPGEPAWYPKVPFDAIAGFSGPMPGGGPTLRVVAATFRGRVVSFEIVAPWSEPSRDAARPVALREKLASLLFFTTVLAVAAAAAWFARRNARLGRGDRRGATRIAGAVFLACVASAVFSVHPAALGNLNPLAPLAPILFVPTGLGGVVFILYLALEPYFRRRYPDLLVSWTRLVGGRFGDPLVGRDLLGGLLLGCASFLVLVAMKTAPSFVASGGETPLYFDEFSLAGIQGVAASLGGRLVDTLMQTVYGPAILFVGTLILRRKVFAVALLWGLWFAITAGRENTLLEVPAAALIASLFVAALLRFGLLGFGAFALSRNLLAGAPLTLDFSLWYAGYGLFFVLLVLALASWGFWAARGGGTLIPETALDG